MIDKGIAVKAMNDDLSINSGVGVALRSGSRLSPQQAHAWALHRAGAALHVCCEVEIEGLLDPERLRLTLADVCSEKSVSVLCNQS